MSFDELLHKLLKAHAVHPNDWTFTVAISGIDGAGKGYITSRLEDELTKRAYKVANINIDPWQHPMNIRLNEKDPARNIYDNIFRWNDFFSQLILPLRYHKRVKLEAKLIRTHADEYYTHLYEYDNPDFLLIDGILLHKQKYFAHYDHRVWIHSSFETALNRALNRNVEKKERSMLIDDYKNYYHAAQHLHLKIDDPLTMADLVYDNDPPVNKS